MLCVLRKVTSGSSVCFSLLTLPPQTCSNLELTRHRFQPCAAVCPRQGDAWRLPCVVRRPGSASSGEQLELAAGLAGRPSFRGPAGGPSFFLQSLLIQSIQLNLAPRLLVLFPVFLCPQIKPLGFSFPFLFFLFSYKVAFSVKFRRHENDQEPLIPELRDQLPFLNPLWTACHVDSIRKRSCCVNIALTTSPPDT